MLNTLVALGVHLKVENIKILIDETNAKDVFVINLDENCNYVDIKVNENEGEEKYLYAYAREQNNRGKFITGLITADNIIKLKKILNQEDIKEKNLFSQKFKSGQITWVLKQKILKDQKILSLIPQESKVILTRLRREIELKQDDIMNDFCKKVLEGSYDRNILLTYRIGGKYLIEINGFSDIFEIAVLGEENFKGHYNGKCMICNNNAFLGKLNKSLPFFTLDKETFLPDGTKKNVHRVFQICKICSLNLISGFKYIKKNLDFAIPNSFGKARLRFWLIPQLNNVSLIKKYLEGFDQNLSSFKNMFDISGKTELISEIDLDLEYVNSELIKNFYTYTAIFYTSITVPRLIESVDGIYPSRFLELSKMKYYVDDIAKRNRNNLKFFFGLLIDFIGEYDFKNTIKKNENERWMKIMGHIMNCIFTQKKINDSLIIIILLERIRLILFNNNIDEFHEIILKATLILDYLYMVKALLPTSNYNKNDSISYSNDKPINFVINFLNDHTALLSTNNLRAICAIGIMTGIIIKAQRRYFDSEKTPFWGQLNRLEMDMKRLENLPSYNWTKLHHYKAIEFENIFTHLTNSEISNLDHKEKIEKELMNLIFVIGIAHGFTIFNQFEDKNWNTDNSGGETD